MVYEAKKFGESDVLDWLRQSLENENLNNVEIRINGTSEGTNEGFVSDIFFATATGVDETGKNKDIRLVVKTNREHGHTDLADLLKLFCEREGVVYKELIPTFQKFQHDKNIAAPFDGIPKCFKAFTTDYDINVLVLQDLRQLGYKLHDKLSSMDTQHIRLVLEEYSKFHALSFALRDQRPEEYKALAEKFPSFSEKLSGTFVPVQARISKHLKEASREDLSEKFDKALERGANNIVDDILGDTVEKSVIIHGDGHNNNFMFKYDEDHKPTKAMILDWQLPFEHSPAMDLSYFLYQVAGRNLNELHEFLKFYHSRLTENLEEMGTDPTIFPFSSLIEHWKKYSSYGFICTIAFLENFFIEEKTKITIGDVTIKYLEDYRRKLIPAVEHFCNCEL